MENIIIDGIKSKKRVAQFGEVLTPKNIVIDMINLIPDEVRNDINSTWLEPACGNGNFLVEILKNKLILAQKLMEYGEDIDILFFRAVSTIYGIDIQADNVRESKYRMMIIIKEIYNHLTGNELGPKLGDALSFVLNKNIIWGDAIEEKFMKNGDELLLSEWNIQGNKVLRKEYTLMSMRDDNILYNVPTNIFKETSIYRVDKAKIVEDEVEFM